MRRILLVAVGLVLAGSVPALAAAPNSRAFRVVVVDRLGDAGWRSLAARGAVGLLVPGVGPTINRSRALAALVRGATFNPYLGGLPRGGGSIAASESASVPRGTSLIVVSLPPVKSREANDRRYRIAVVGRGFHGLLRSPTTRIDGLVSIVDVAPTALGRGRGSLSSVTVTRPLARLVELDKQIHSNNRLKLPALIIIACVLIFLGATRPRVGIPAILSALLASIAVGALHITSEPVILAMLIAGMVGGGFAVARVCRSDGRLLLAIAGVLVLHLLLFVLHPDWVALSPLGPTQNSRFWGVGNQLETLLLGPILAGALIASRRYGLVGFAAFSLLGLVLVTDNRLGSDGGGAIVLSVALACLGARLLRLGVRGFTSLLLLAASVVLTIVTLNLHLPGPNHLRSAFGHGLRGLLAVAEHRVPLSYLPAIRDWPLVLPLALCLAVSLAVALLIAERSARDLVIAAAVAIGTSLLVNDSAAYELAGGVAVLAGLARFTPIPSPLVVSARAPLTFPGRPLPNEAARRAE
jgi:hypothetical protein